MSPVQMFSEGGPFMYVLLLLGLFNLAIIVFQIGAARRVELRPLMWGMLVAVAATGGLASVVGMMQVFRAAALAAPEMKQTLMAHGLSIALTTMAFAFLICAAQAVLIGIAGSIRATVIAPGGEDA